MTGHPVYLWLAFIVGELLFCIGAVESLSRVGRGWVTFTAALLVSLAGAGLVGFVAWSDYTGLVRQGRKQRHSLGGTLVSYYAWVMATLFFLSVVSCP